jgi:hypothetical protein
MCSIRRATQSSTAARPAFGQQYGTEEQCRAIVIASRWPHGFECPGRSASTHLPLRLWFRAIYQLTQTKQGISSIELGRRLWVTQTKDQTQAEAGHA